MIPKNIKNYLAHFGSRSHPILEALRIQTSKMPECKMQVAPDLAHALCFFARLIDARSILEIGTYTGYSSLAMALGTQAHITTCDHNIEWTKIARRYWEKAHVEDRITLVLGDALQTLKTFQDEERTFDFIFIDANKNSYPDFLDAALALVSQKGLIAIDNMLWDGEVADESIQTSTTITLRNLNARIQADPNLDFVLLPVDDGLSIVRKVNS